MLDFFADAHSFLTEKRAFGEAPGGSQTLNQVAAANYREHRGGAEAFVAPIGADILDAARQDLDRQVVLPRLVVSRAQIIISHGVRSGIGLDDTEL